MEPLPTATAPLQEFTEQEVPEVVRSQDSAMRFPWKACELNQPASANHQCWQDLRPRQYVAGDSSVCRPVPKEQSCSAMTSYVPTHVVPPFVIAIVVTIAVAIAAACALRFCWLWQKRKDFVPVESGEDR